MGKDWLNYLSDIDFSDWISIFSILVHSALAIWIVFSIQKNQTNKRVLKDYLISEFLELRTNYKEKIDKIYSSNAQSKPLIPWFKLMNVKVNNLVEIANEKYGVDRNILLPFQTELRGIIMEDEGFINSFKDNNKVILTESAKNNIVLFLQTNTHLFNKIIININDA